MPNVEIGFLTELAKVSPFLTDTIISMDRFLVSQGPCLGTFASASSTPSTTWRRRSASPTTTWGPSATPSLRCRPVATCPAMSFGSWQTSSSRCGRRWVRPQSSQARLAPIFASWLRVARFRQSNSSRP